MRIVRLVRRVSRRPHGREVLPPPASPRARSRMRTWPRRSRVVARVGTTGDRCGSLATSVRDVGMSRNKWFESVAEAQRRARRRVPRTVYSALLAGSEAGVTYRDNTDAFSELGFAPH